MYCSRTQHPLRSLTVLLWWRSPWSRVAALCVQLLVACRTRPFPHWTQDLAHNRRGKHFISSVSLPAKPEVDINDYFEKHNEPMKTQALENLKKIQVTKGQNKSFHKPRIHQSASLLLLWQTSPFTAGHSLSSLIIIFPIFLSLPAYPAQPNSTPPFTFSPPSSLSAFKPCSLL